MRAPIMITLNIEPNWISPYVFSCWVTLTEKKIDFTVATRDFMKGETREAEYLTRTITGRVPTLFHDDFALGESVAIVEYLEDAFPNTPRVLPSDPKKRARCRQLMSWLRSDETLALRMERSTHSMFFTRADKPLTPDGQASAKKLCEVASRVITTTSEANLFGDWSIADADLAFILHRLIANEDDVPAAVKAWAQKQWQRPSVRAFVERDRPAPSA